MFIPKEFIRQLVDQADLKELIGSEIKLQQRGNIWFGLCPFHEEKTPSFSVNPEKGFYHCFGCGAHGSAIDFLMHSNGNDFIVAIETLADRLGVPVPRTQTAQSEPDVSVLLRKAMEHWQQQLKQSPEAIDYLKSRQINSETAKRYCLGYAANDWQGLMNALSDEDKPLLLAAGLVKEKQEQRYDTFRHRIIFPISQANGRLCGFGARVINPADQPKYLNSAETAQFSKRRLLFGLPQAMAGIKEKKRLIICEGYMDVVILSQAGFTETVATMGTAATTEQMKKAVQVVSTIIFAFDADSAGQKGALRALEGILPALKDGVSVSFLRLPEGDDPDSYICRCGASAFEARIAEATPLGDFISDALWQPGQGDNEEGRATGMMKEGERLIRCLNPEEAPYWRQLLTDKFSQRAKMENTVLKKAVNRSYRPTKQSALRMKPEDKLFILLCCLTVRPDFIDRLQYDVPLPGAASDAAIVAQVLSTLRWNMDEEPPAVPALLEKDGYTALATQIRSSVSRRFSVTHDIEAEFEFLVVALKRAHAQLTGAGKRAWLDKLLAESENDQPH